MNGTSKLENPHYDDILRSERLREICPIPIPSDSFTQPINWRRRRSRIIQIPPQNLRKIISIKHLRLQYILIRQKTPIRQIQIISIIQRRFVREDFVATGIRDGEIRCIFRDLLSHDVERVVLAEPGETILSCLGRTGGKRHSR
jgi:hypothetical protein